MIVKKKLLIACCILLMLTGSAPAFAFQKKVRMQRDFDIRVGNEVIVKETGMKLKFTALVEDSRCPEGVDCIWAGNGKINVSARIGRHKSVTFDLNTTIESKSFTYQGYEIELVRLAPYPKHDVTTKKEDYVATLKVTRSKR